MKTKFVKRLKQSQKAVEVVAEWWRARDYIVDIPETKKWADSPIHDQIRDAGLDNAGECPECVAEMSSIPSEIAEDNP